IHYATGRFFRQLLAEINERRIERIDPAALPEGHPLRTLKALPAEQRRRALLGHAIVSSQLADINRPRGHRGIRAAVAVHGLGEARSALTRAEDALEAARPKNAGASRLAELEREIDAASARVDQRQAAVNALLEPYTLDDKFWAAVMTVLTIALLFRGRYGLIQNLSLALVVAFTFITVGNVIALQNEQQWHVSLDEFLYGLSFHLPQTFGEKNALATALATFGIIGVGANELVSYPYWCLEKGYAKFAGPRSAEESWPRRAAGWMRVMRYDAFLSMIIYTVATLAFFLTGVAVLYNEGRDPDGMRMVSTLAKAYVPVFGAYAGWLFLIGAFAVLYSTFLVASASHARTITDGLKLFGLIDRESERTHRRSVSMLSCLVPLVCLAVYLAPGANPVALVIAGGVAQATLLPMIGVGAVYLRWTRSDARLRPSPLWDVCLLVSCLGLLVAGVYGVYQRLS
ncbi:MAG: divalent metal cation transporter, partial [Vicinamibacterales bacterium]